MEGKQGATAIVSADRNRKIVSWNGESTFSFGYSEQSLGVGSCKPSRDPPCPREIEGMNHG